MEHGIEIGEHNRPQVITVNLLEDEEAINITKDGKKTDWDEFFINKEEYARLIKKYNQGMKEVDFPANFDYAVSSNYNPVKVKLESEIKGKKIWLDNHSKERPNSVVIYLLANDEIVGRKVLTAENHWNYRFTNLPIYDEDRNKLDYQIIEKSVEGYKTSYENYDIRNLRIGQSDARVIKDWMSGEENKGKLPDSISLSLLRNQEKIKEIKLSAENAWEYHIQNLDLYDDKGKSYNYSIEESIVDDSKGHPAKLIIGERDLANDRRAKNTGITLLAGGALAFLGLAFQIKEKIKGKK